MTAEMTAAYLTAADPSTAPHASADLARAIQSYAQAHPQAGGLVQTPLPGVTFMCVHAPSGLMHALYKPTLCLMLSGAKQLAFGREVQVFSAGQSVIVRADVPIVAQVVSASRAAPYVAFALDLDMGTVREVASQMPAPVADGPEPQGMLLGQNSDAALVDCAQRVMRLLNHPEALPVLAPGIVREMHYWLLAGRHGPALRQVAAADGTATRIGRAVALLRAQFANSLPVEHLAAVAGMSPSSFHQHFKALTSLSPRQFQKQLRLLEARRLMFNAGASASGAAFAVGYESVPQFTREYARLFGAPPRRDKVEHQAAA